MAREAMLETKASLIFEMLDGSTIPVTNRHN
jgi:hypothetical protein